MRDRRLTGVKEITYPRPQFAKAPTANDLWRANSGSQNLTASFTKNRMQR